MKKHSGMHIAENLKKFRKARSLRQSEVAQHMQMARTTVIAIEQGKRPLTTEDLEAFAALYGVTINDITHVDDIPADAPTVTRIAEAFGLSPLTIEYHISRLLGEGRLTLDQSPAVQWLRVA